MAWLTKKPFSTRMEKGPQALKWGGGGGSKGEEAREEEEETHAWGHILYECLLRDLPSVFIYIHFQT